ncbi:MAG: cell division protein FtsZ [Muribaculaceae bacterium]|nr:cell division protein FtsZ [Muribaculaceae bacterium]
MTQAELESDHGFILNETPKTEDPIIIKVIGVGGGGSNAISHMYSQGIPHISYALCNTDRQALNSSPVPTKVLIGPSVTKGLGAGNDPVVAREAAEESVPEIKKLLEDETQMVFITAGMGGGTGTGAAPVVAKVAHEMGLLTIGIVTIPFLLEGETKILKALKGVKEMSKHVDALLVINNEILIEDFGMLDFISAVAKADDTLSNAAKSIAEIIYSKGYINLDFRDVATTLRNSGQAIISTGYGEGEKRVTAAVNDALNSPLLRHNDINSSSRILFNLYFSSKSKTPLLMSEIDEFKAFTRKISGLDMIYGVAFDDTLGDKVKVSILAAGIKSEVLSEDDDDFEELKGKRYVDEQDDERSPRSKQPTDRELDTLRNLYGGEKVDIFKEHREAQNFIILTREQMENDRILELLETTPAYNRGQNRAEAIRAGQKNENPEDGLFLFGESPSNDGKSKDNDNSVISF